MKSKALGQNLAVATTVAVVLGLLSSSSYCVEAQVPEVPLATGQDALNTARDTLSQLYSNYGFAFEDSELEVEPVVRVPSATGQDALNAARDLLKKGLLTAYVGEVASMLTELDGIDFDYERKERLPRSNAQDFDRWDLTSQISWRFRWLVEESELEGDPFETEPEDPFDSDFGGGSSWMITDERDRAGL